MRFRFAYLHSKGQGHKHFNCECLWNCDRKERITNVIKYEVIYSLSIGIIDIFAFDIDSFLKVMVKVMHIRLWIYRNLRQVRKILIESRQWGFDCLIYIRNAQAIIKDISTAFQASAKGSDLLRRCIEDDEDSHVSKTHLITTVWNKISQATCSSCDTQRIAQICHGGNQRNEKLWFAWFQEESQQLVKFNLSVRLCCVTNYSWNDFRTHFAYHSCFANYRSRSCWSHDISITSSHCSEQLEKWSLIS